MFTVQPFTYSEADYAAMMIVDTAVFADLPMGLEVWQHIDKTRPPDLPYHRDLLYQDGEIVAWGEYGQNQWSYHPRKFFWNVYVIPAQEDSCARERPALRAFYLEHVLAAVADRDLIAITSSFDANRAPYHDFFLGRGFAITMREPLSQLDMADFDAGAFASVTARVQESGIRFANLADLKASDPDWERKLYDLEWTLAQDVPNQGDPVQRPLDEWRASYWENPAFREDSWWVALDGERYVGMTMFWQDQVIPAQMNCGLAGVVPAYRRRGIVTALKVHAIEYARGRGITTLIVQNRDTNPMYDINRKLGFKPIKLWTHYELALQPAVAAG